MAQPDSPAEWFQGIDPSKRGFFVGELWMTWLGEVTYLQGRFEVNKEAAGESLPPLRAALFNCLIQCTSEHGRPLPSTDKLVDGSSGTGRPRGEVHVPVRPVRNLPWKVTGLHGVWSLVFSNSFLQHWLLCWAVGNWLARPDKQLHQFARASFT